MAKVEGGQNIPAELLELYQGVLTEEQPDTTTRRRYPWKLPHMQRNRSGVTPAQAAHREIFQRCVRCYNVQPDSGGAVPPATGPRNRSWWYTDAIGSGLWYYDYFIQQTMNDYLVGAPPVWCGTKCTQSAWVNSKYPDKVHLGQSLLVGYTYNEYYRTYIRTKPDYCTRIVAYRGWGPDDSSEKNVLVKVYKTGTGWWWNSICWNNAPALEDFIGDFTITVTGPTWRTPFEFYAGGVGVQSVCLICEDYGKGVGFYSYTAPAAYVPYHIA